MNPVLNHTKALTNTITEITIVLRGINSCNFSIPFDSLIITGTENRPAIIVIATSLTKSDGGSKVPQISIG